MRTHDHVHACKPVLHWLDILEEVAGTGLHKRPHGRERPSLMLAERREWEGPGGDPRFNWWHEPVTPTERKA